MVDVELEVRSWLAYLSIQTANRKEVFASTVQKHNNNRLKLTNMLYLVCFIQTDRESESKQPVCRSPTTRSDQRHNFLFVCGLNKLQSFREHRHESGINLLV